MFVIIYYCFNNFVDNMPVTWCYQLEEERQYCSTGFPMGCFSRESRSQQDTCSINVNIYWYYIQINEKEKHYF